MKPEDLAYDVAGEWKKRALEAEAKVKRLQEQNARLTSDGVDMLRIREMPEKLRARASIPSAASAGLSYAADLLEQILNRKPQL